MFLLCKSKPTSWLTNCVCIGIIETKEPWIFYEETGSDNLVSYGIIIDIDRVLP